MSENTRTVDPPEPSRTGSDDTVDAPAEDNGHGHRHLGIALALISMAQLMVVLDATIVNIALPSLKEDLGFTDALRKLHPDETVYTFWHYMRKRWERNSGLRLDHLLLSPALAPRLLKAGVDKKIRGEEGASDHAPAWVVLK